MKETQINVHRVYTQEHMTMHIIIVHLEVCTHVRKHLHVQVHMCTRYA